MLNETSSEIKVSVIVPVWNPGPGFSRCIESLRNQTLKDIEMIFVDDRGTDDSITKVYEAAKHDSRIKILKNKNNIGAGASRNRGIEFAKGEYLSFVDSDDWVDQEFLELLFSESKKKTVDIIKGSKTTVDSDGSYTVIGNMNQLILNDHAAGKPLYTTFVREHFTAIYRREYIIENNIYYGSSPIGEDSTFLLKACSQTDSVAIVDGAYYVSCYREDSASHALNESYLFGHLLAIREKEDYALNNIEENQYLYDYIKRRFYLAVNEGGRFINDLNAREALVEYTEELRKVLMNSAYSKVLTNNDFTLLALCKYGYLLPSEAYSFNNVARSIRQARLIKVWVDFLLNHPNETNACLKELKPLIIRANKITKKCSDSFEDRKQGRKLFITQVKRLPWKIKARLLFSRFI